MPESVVLRPFTGVGLVSSLHFLSSSLEAVTGATPGPAVGLSTPARDRPECLDTHARRDPRQLTMQDTADFSRRDASGQRPSSQVSMVFLGGTWNDSH